MNKRRRRKLDRMFARMTFALGLYIERRGNTWTTWELG